MASEHPLQQNGIISTEPNPINVVLHLDQEIEHTHSSNSSQTKSGEAVAGKPYLIFKTCFLMFWFTVG